MCLFGAAITLAPRNALGAAPPAHLEVEGCPTLDAHSVQRIFAADLGTPETSEAGPDVTEVTVTCENDRVTIRVRDPISRKTVKRSIDPKSFGTGAESRIVAIAASELVLASWAELSANPKPQVPPEGPPPSDAAVETARSVVRARSGAEPAGTGVGTPAGKATVTNMDSSGPHGEGEQAEAAGATPKAPHDDRAHRRREVPLPPVSDRVTAVVSFRTLPGGGTVWGGGARFGRERDGVVSWALDTLVENGVLSERDDTGALQQSNATNVSVGAWVLFYAHAAGGALTLRAGGGLRAGALTQYDHTAPAVWGWPMLVLSPSVRASSLVIEFSGESGFANLTGKNLQGFWVSGQLGVGIAL